MNTLSDTPTCSPVDDGSTDSQSSHHQCYNPYLQGTVAARRRAAAGPAVTRRLRFRLQVGTCESKSLVKVLAHWPAFGAFHGFRLGREKTAPGDRVTPWVETFEMTDAD